VLRLVALPFLEVPLEAAGRVDKKHPPPPLPGWNL
jgi:hypothetical protein